jgi:hypothetical protein
MRDEQPTYLRPCAWCLPGWLQVQRDEREGTGMGGWDCVQLHTHHHLPLPSHPALRPAAGAAAQAAAAEMGAVVCHGVGEAGELSPTLGAAPTSAAPTAGTALLSLPPVQRLHASLLMAAQLCDAVGHLLCGWVPPEVMVREMKVCE